jgi:hypothetical protein
MSKKDKRIELENKINERSKECPYCKQQLQFGYIAATTPVVWGEDTGTLFLVKENIERLSGTLTPINQIPTLRCNNCGIIIGQFR